MIHQTRKTLDRNTSLRAKLLAERADKKRAKALAGLKGKKVGGHLVMRGGDMDVQLGDELSESWRQLEVRFSPPQPPTPRSSLLPPSFIRATSSDVCAFVSLHCGPPSISPRVTCSEIGSRRSSTGRSSSPESLRRASASSTSTSRTRSTVRPLSPLFLSFLCVPLASRAQEADTSPSLFPLNSLEEVRVDALLFSSFSSLPLLCIFELPSPLFSLLAGVDFPCPPFVHA